MQSNVVETGVKKMFYLSVKGFNDKIKHNEMDRAKLTGTLKSKMLEMLKQKTACAVRTDLKNELVSNYDPDCPILPSEKNLRQMVYRENRKNSNIRDENPIIAICKMKKEPKFFNCIANIGLDPFYAYYSTPMQLAFVCSELRQRYIKVSIDATGIPVRVPSECSKSERTGKARYIFLYSVTFHGSKRNLPVFQMLSQEHTSRKISEWLKCWQISQLRQRTPNEIVIDQSAALLLALVSTFTKSSSVNEYLSHLYETIFEDRQPPDLYIRFDRSHFIKSIMVCKEFPKKIGKQFSAIKFYRRIIGFLVQEEDTDIVEQTIFNVFILLHSKYIDDEATKKLHDGLHEQSRTHKIEKEYKKEKNYEDLTLPIDSTFR